jgi:hypothetical protein
MPAGRPCPQLWWKWHQFTMLLSGAWGPPALGRLVNIPPLVVPQSQPLNLPPNSTKSNQPCEQSLLLMLVLHRYADMFGLEE